MAVPGGVALGDALRARDREESKTMALRQQHERREGRLEQSAMDAIAVITVLAVAVVLVEVGVLG